MLRSTRKRKRRLFVESYYTKETMSVSIRSHSGVDFTISQLKNLFYFLHVWSLAKNEVIALVTSRVTPSSGLAVVRDPQIRVAEKRVEKSKLHVSEVHIPGYRKSKLPFILHDFGERNHELNIISAGREG